MSVINVRDSMAYYEASSPTLLASQPATSTDDLDRYRSDGDWAEIFSYLEQRLASLRTWRYSWWTYWAQLAEYILPRRYHWLVTANLMRRGNPVNQAIVDSTATLAMEICAAGMADGLMPTTRRWFKHGVALPNFHLDEEAKEWLEELDETVELVLGQSNFYNVMAQAYQDLATFGTAPVIMYEDSEDVIRCYGPCAGEYYLGAGSRFEIDTLYREFTLTVLQIVDMFGFENCPQSVQEQWVSKSTEVEYVVGHAIEPNFNLRSPKGGKAEIAVVKGGFAFREVYWLRGVQTGDALSRRGFHERPFAVARWSTVSNDAYGRGPGMDALPDIKQLQLETRRKAEGIEKQVRPPMGADPALKNEPSSINPGHVTYVSSSGPRTGFWPLFEVKPDLNAMVADIKEIQKRIDDAFLVPVFNIISQMEGVQPRNELEISERKAEKLQRLGPVIGLIKTEFAAPLMARGVNIVERRKLVRPRPKSLIGVPISAEYIDMVTLAQLGSETVSMERLFAVAGKLSAAAKAAQVPDPLRIVNLDESLRIYGDRVLFPEKAMYTVDQVQQHDQAKAQQAQQEKIAQATPATVDAAKTLSDTDVGGGVSALQTMLGTGGGGIGAKVAL